MIRVVNTFEFTALHYPFNQNNAIKLYLHKDSIERYLAYILQHHIEQADVVCENLELLQHFPMLKFLRITPSAKAESFDFSPLYSMPCVRSLNCRNQFGLRMQHTSTIDYSNIQGLESLFVGVNKGTVNYNCIEGLKSLSVGGYIGKNHDLSDLFVSTELDTLNLLECKTRSLDGIGISPKLQCLYISYNRSLESIKALKDVRSTLRSLRITNCPKIQDFSVLYDLENLELLELSGSNSLPSLDFIKKMKNLKTFIFSMNVLDGDIAPCLELSYVYSERNRKHYNYNDAELPKGKYYRGNANIELWRRLE